MEKEITNSFDATNESFRDLNKANLPKKDGDFFVDGKRIKKSEKIVTGVWFGEEYCEGIPMVEIDGVPYCIKPQDGKYSIIDIASTKMYNEIGFKTPQVYPLRKYDVISEEDELYTMIQDVTAMGDYEFISEQDFTYNKIQYRPDSKFEPLYDEKTMERFLEFMTEDCLNERISLALNDTIRTEYNRHGGDVFYYKKKGAKKYEGIIPVNNEFMQVIFSGVKNKIDFLRWKNKPYVPINASKKTEPSYKEKVEDIMDLLHSGKLTPTQIQQLKEALSYDLPMAMLEQKNNKYFGEHAKNNYDATSGLWEYNRDTIGKELGL